MDIPLNNGVDQVVGSIKQEVKSRAIRAANELRNAELEVLRGARTGRVYRRPFSRSTYRASAPGEPPAVRSGVLRQSWRATAGSETSGSVLVVKPAITTDVKYAPKLQAGTDRMQPRPYEDTVLERAMPGISQIYSDLKKGGTP